MDDTSLFAQRLTKLLDQTGMTQIELAGRIGVTRAAMSRYVSGDREPRFATLLRIAEELNVHVNELLGTEQDNFETALRIVARTNLTEAQKAELLYIIDGSPDA